MLNLINLHTEFLIRNSFLSITNKQITDVAKFKAVTKSKLLSLYNEICFFYVKLLVVGFDDNFHNFFVYIFFSSMPNFFTSDEWWKVSGLRSAFQCISITWSILVFFFHLLFDLKYLIVDSNMCQLLWLESQLKAPGIILVNMHFSLSA